MYSMLILKKIVGTVLYQTGDEYVSVDNVVYPYYMVKWKFDDNSSKTGVICAFSLTPFIENTQVNEIIPFEL
jgi:hypothetical protein